MRTSIQSKFLLMCVLLIVLATSGISVSYYSLTRKDKHREFQQRIQIALNIILDDFDARQMNLRKQAEVFLSDEILSISTSRYMEDKERLSSISFVSLDLAKAATELRRFGNATSARKIGLYGADKRLLAAYQNAGEHETAGVYVRGANKDDIYLPANEPERLTAMLLGREGAAGTTVPEGISANYDRELPAAMSLELFSLEGELGFRVCAPLFYKEEASGILLMEFYYTQGMVERYAKLTQAEVNLFAGERFSLGTLPLQHTVKSDSLFACRALAELTVEKKILPLTFGKQDYYQLQCGLQNDRETIGALTISLSQDIEEQAFRQVRDAVLLLSALILGVTLVLSWFFSRKIARPITKIARLIHQISRGDLSHVFDGKEADLSRNGFLEKENASPQAAAKHKGEEVDEVVLLTHSFYGMAEYLRDMAEIAGKISHGDSTQTICLRSERDLLGNAFRDMLSYIQEITSIAQTLSDGDLSIDVRPRSKQDLLNHSLRNMIVYIQGVADVAETIAGGDLEVRVQPKSEQDLLNQSLLKMVDYLQEVAAVTEKISQNDLQALVIPRSEHDTLNLSVYRMVSNLQVAREKVEMSVEEIERQNWLKSGQAELNDTMRGEQQLSILARHVITYLAEYLGAQVGLLYLAEEQDGHSMLRLTGSYAYSTRQGLRNEFSFGEGLVGQAALERESILFSDVPEGYIRIVSGIGEMTPQNILVIPFLYEGEVKGVLELGTLYDFAPQHREFLETAAENIAIAFHTAQSRVKMQHLLEETQRQSETLQTQQSELRRSNAELEARTNALQASEATLQAQQERLRQSNEELRAQTEALKTSEEKLQVQQEELRQTNEELEEKTKELEKQWRVLQEKNSALEQSRQLIEEKVRELEQANTYKSEFLANISHELRTPLNSILILSKLFHENKEGNLTKKQKTSARMLYTAVTNWVAMIDDVMAVSEMDSGKFTLDITEMHLSDFIGFVEQQARRPAEEKGLAFSLDVAEDVPAVIQTDSKRIQQVIGNLLSNAVKFTESGSIRVRISQSAPHKGLDIEVADTGIGISQKQQESIFEAFQQADGSTTRKYGGVGLGLSLSRQIAHMLGGEIFVYSEEGQGSTFSLHLPIQAQQAAIEADEKPSQAGSVHTMEENGKVLTVGKDGILPEDLLELFAGEGIRVVNVATIQDAYSYLQKEHSDCIIIDIAFTELAGIAFLHQSIAERSEGRIPIVIYTAKELSKDEEVRLQAQTESIIIKGVRSGDRLLGEVKRLIAQPGTAAPDPDIQNGPDRECELQGKTLLIADDDIRNLYALANALEEYGINAIMATHGKEALSQLSKHPEIDLALLDIMMPEMDGYETIKKIREQQAYQQLPIIVLTAKAMKGDREKCLEAGANDYLSKPLDLSKLLSLLRVWLTR